MLSDSYSAPKVDASLPSPLTLTLTHTRCCFFVDVVSTPAESQASSMQSYILPTLYKIGCLSDFSIFFFFFFCGSRDEGKCSHCQNNTALYPND